MTRKNKQTPEKDHQTFAAENKIARQLITKFSQAFISWFPFGSSGFALVSLLLKQEWFITFLVFPLMIISIAWGAFTTSFLKQIQHHAQEIGQESANAFVRWLRAIATALKWQLAGVEDKYLQCQGNACLYYTTEGYQTTFKPLLQDVFVPLELSPNFFRAATGEYVPMVGGYGGEMQGEEGFTIWDVLQRTKTNPTYRNLVILALGGYGKTTLLRHITYTYSQKKLLRGVPKLLPVLLLLRKWQALIVKEKPDLVTLIEKYHLPSLPQGKDLSIPNKGVAKKRDTM